MKAALRAFWLRQMYQWHWISAALSLIAMLGFAITGFTLNHAADISAKPTVTIVEGIVPEDLLRSLERPEGQQLPDALDAWLTREMSLRVGGRPAEWSDDEIYMSISQPGGDAFLSIDLLSGDVFYEKKFRGWISFFNDLHKGRDTGEAWRWFIDIFAAACIIFCVTGLVIMQFHAQRRPVTWPLVGLGFIAPLLLVVLFIH
jgi:hypothetical protein